MDGETGTGRKRQGTDLQFIQQQEPETIHHPGFERHARLPVFQRLEVVFAEIEIIFVSQREEVHAWLVLQVISLIVDAISRGICLIS